MSEPARSSALHEPSSWETAPHHVDLKAPGPWATLIATSVCLALLYYLLVVLGMKLRVSTSTLALLWPSNALLTATLVLTRKRHWWTYLMAVIPAHIAAMSSYQVGPWWLFYQVATNSLLAIACAVVLQSFRPEILHFETLRGLLNFLAVAIAIPGAVTFVAIYPMIKVTPDSVLLAHGWSRDVASVWRGYWIKNTASLIVFVPTILVAVTRGRSWLRGLSSWLRVAEGVLLTVLLIIVTVRICGQTYASGHVQPVLYLIPISLLLWAIRFGPPGACFSVTLLVCISAWYAAGSENPFLRSGAIDSAIALQIAWIAIAAPVLSVAAIIQERKTVRLAFVQSEERFRSLFNKAPIGIALEDLAGNLLFVNPALSRMLGYAEDELTRMNCSEFADEEDEREDWENFQAMLAGVIGSYQIEKRYRRKDGSRMWGQLNVSTLNLPGQQTRVLATVEDITEKRAALEDLKRAHSELQQLTPRLISAQEEEKRRISRELHDDFGQRLALLRIELDVLKRELSGEKTAVQTGFRKVLGELDELVVDVHNMSHQLHSSKLEYLGLSAALGEVCRQVAQQRAIAINLTADRLPQSLPDAVSLCFYRVAQEALTNAVKHSRSSRVEVGVTCTDAVLRMRIKDFGVGFDPAAQTTGLGLVTMQERLKIIGGVLRFNSIPGGGTEVEAEANIGQANFSPKIA